MINNKPLTGDPERALGTVSNTSVVRRQIVAEKTLGTAGLRVATGALRGAKITSSRAFVNVIQGPTFPFGHATLVFEVEIVFA